MYCKSCGYNLRDLQETRCPECSNAFDAADPKTYFSSRLEASRGRIPRFPALTAAFVLVSIANLLLVGFVLDARFDWPFLVIGPLYSWPFLALPVAVWLLERKLRD